MKIKAQDLLGKDWVDKYTEEEKEEEIQEPRKVTPKKTKEKGFPYTKLTPQEAKSALATLLNSAYKLLDEARISSRLNPVDNGEVNKDLLNILDELTKIIDKINIFK